MLSTLLQAAVTWVSAIRVDIAMKPVDVMGYQESMSPGTQGSQAL